MEATSKYLNYLGWYPIFIPVFITLFSFLFFIIIYCKIKGPNKSLATISFYIPMIGSLILGILLFYTSYFWSTLFIYVIAFFLMNFVSFSALEKALEDKTGLGVTMFSGLISMYIFFFCALLSFFFSD